MRNLLKNISPVEKEDTGTCKYILDASSAIMVHDRAKKRVTLTQQNVSEKNSYFLERKGTLRSSYMWI